MVSDYAVSEDFLNSKYMYSMTTKHESEAPVQIFIRGSTRREKAANISALSLLANNNCISIQKSCCPNVKMDFSYLRHTYPVRKVRTRRDHEIEFISVIFVFSQLGFLGG